MNPDEFKGAVLEEVQTCRQVFAKDKFISSWNEQSSNTRNFFFCLLLIPKIIVYNPNKHKRIGQLFDSYVETDPHKRSK